MKDFFNFLAAGIAIILFVIAVSISMVLLEHLTGNIMLIILLPLAFVIWACVNIMIVRYDENTGYLKTSDFRWILTFTIIFIFLFFKILSV